MQSSVIDIVPLMLLIVFFGVQQRSHRQLYYRFWFIGWALILLSFVLWRFNGKQQAHANGLDLLRIDVLLLASASFLLSFLPNEKKLKHLLLKGSIVLLPALAVIDLQEVRPLPQWLAAATVLAWEAYGLYCLSVLLTPELRLRYRRVTVAGLLGCIAVPIDVWMHPIHDLLHWALVEMLVASVVLYGVCFKRRTLAGTVTTAGYGLWAVYYIVQMWARPDSPVMHLLYAYWNLPKYLVAFSMILKVFEDSQEKQERQAEEFRMLYVDFRRLYEGHPHSMMIYERETGRLLSVNRMMMEKSGYSREELSQLGMGDLELPRDEELVAMELLVPQPAGGRRGRFLGKDGGVVWLNVYENDIVFQGVKARIVTVRDISDQLQFSNLLMHRASHDALTGLPNRTLFASKLQECLEQSARNGTRAAVLSVDVDHFKRVNDSLGHAAGDECLRAVAERLRGRIRQQDTVARTGGEEFMAVIGGVYGMDGVSKLAANLLQAFEQPLAISGRILAVTVSIGVALFPEDGHDAETLQKRSDEALYQAKGAGRNCARFAGIRE